MRNFTPLASTVLSLAALALAAGAVAQPGPSGQSGKPVPAGKAARSPSAPAPSPAAVAPPPVAGWSALEEAQASPVTARLVDWVGASQDNGKLPYMVIDKEAAALLVFDPKGKLLGASPVLIGVARGDESSPGIGSMDLAKIGPAERTTPAGRFVARYGQAAGGQRVLWVDWSTSVALHPVVTGNKRERRLERLLSPSPVDNRITYGCINVPTAFYKETVYPLFRKTGGVVYVLPDVKPLEAVFPGVLVRSAPALPEPERGSAAAPRA